MTTHWDQVDPAYAGKRENACQTCGNRHGGEPAALDADLLTGSWNQHFFDRGEGHYCQPICLHSILDIYHARLTALEQQ